MKIIIPDLNLPYFYNMTRCLQTIVSKPEIEIELMLWNPQIKSTVDLFDEARPDIIFMHEQLLTPAFNIMLQEFDCRYILATGRPYPELHRPPAITLTSESALPNFGDSDTVMLTTPAASVDPLMMRTTVKDSDIASERTRSDILVMTQHNMQLEDNVLFMIDYLCSTYRTKIIGDTAVDSYHYLGMVNPIERANFIGSTELLIDFGSYDFLDASLMKTPSLLYRSTGNSEFKRFQTLKELKEHTDYLLKNEKSRKEYANQCHQNIIQQEWTYHHQCSNLFALLEESHIASTFIDTLKEIIS